MRRIVTLATAGCLALGGAPAAGTTARGRRPDAGTPRGVGPAAASVQPRGGRGGGAAAPSITWGPCADVSLKQANAECGFLSVPLDHSRPQSGTIKLAALAGPAHLARVGVPGHHAGQPGRPRRLRAQPGRARPPTCPSTPATPTTGSASTPAASGPASPRSRCDPSYFKGNRAVLRPGDRRAVDRVDEPGRSLRQGVRQARRDAAAAPQDGRQRRVTWMPSARRWAQPQLNYYGFSYGTYLGQVYATLFPARVRRMVLDSNVDPRGVWYQAQPRPGPRLRADHGHWFSLAGQVQRRLPPGHTADEVRQLFYEKETALEGIPPGASWARRVGRRVLVGRLLAVDVAGPRRRLRRLGPPRRRRPGHRGYEATDTPGDDNGYAIYLGRRSAPTPRGRQSWSTWPRTTPRLDRSAPFLTWANAWFNAPCRTWPAKPGTPVDGRRRQTTQRAADRRDPRRRNAVRGQHRGPSAVPTVQPDRRAGRHHARRLAAGQRLRRRQDRGLPGDRRPAGAACRGAGGRRVRAAAAAGP